MNINVTKPTGVICKTQGKYCAEDITVVPVLEEKSATPTQSAQEIVPSAGNCGISKLNLGAIQAYQGTATPAQSEQTINPTSGKFFSSFKVGAIPSDYVIPTGTLQITENGVYDVTEKASVNVNVPSGVEEVATAAAMDALLVEANVGKYYKFTGTTDSNYTNGDIYLVEGAEQDQLAGTWVFNEALNTTTLATTYVNFTSNGKTCSSIQRSYSDRPFAINDMFYNFDGVDRNVYNLGIWVNAGYKTIVITSKLSEVTAGEMLLAWLQANGTKQ